MVSTLTSRPHDSADRRLSFDTRPLGKAPHRHRVLAGVDPAGSTNNRIVVVALALLIVVSLWAFTEDTSPVRTEAGERVDPSSAYNPVAAGEKLPDGFRQLLPRDAIRPVYDPTFVDAASVPWPGGTQVIGVTLGDEAKAYPVSFLNGRELVVDEIDKVPILVSW